MEHYNASWADTVLFLRTTWHNIITCKVRPEGSSECKLICSHFNSQEMFLAMNFNGNVSTLKGKWRLFGLQVSDNFC